MLARLEQGLYGVLKRFTELLVLVLVFMVAGQILSRQFNLRWLATPDEIVTMTFSWLAFLGAALMVRDNGHLRAGLLDEYVERKPSLRKPYKTLMNLLLLAFEVIFFRSSLVLMRIGTIKRSAQLQWPQTLWYLPVLVAAALMLLYTGVGLVQNVLGREAKTSS